MFAMLALPYVCARGVGLVLLNPLMPATTLGTVQTQVRTVFLLCEFKRAAPTLGAMFLVDFGVEKRWLIHVLAPLRDSNGIPVLLLTLSSDVQCPDP